MLSESLPCGRQLILHLLKVAPRVGAGVSSDSSVQGGLGFHSL